ncbi:open rectifier potassium channel protein 1-like isoform X4 [Frieseomelitta varia]|uniref:open rectifier potassium channel protein 1-like isoform X4 n=1 Tax=Frieseomelitta varia TaxID=561572 RepID=UPI001CB69E7E|nr:open rectifier potassium channel protein 1-like isoform X4 [Frieseomelitta varia]
MDVPLFPAPPILGGVATPVSDVIDVAKLTPVSLSAVTCTRKQHVEKKMHRALKIHKIRHSTHRNLVHPKQKDQIECRVTKFHITMTEQQRHDETEDDNDVVFAIGLVWLLTIWAIVGAVAFCAIEGPREREQVVKLKNMQKDLAVGLATELRQLRTEKEEDVEPLWSNKVHQYVEKHEELLLMAVNSGYGENGNSGQLWTFPGCILFALSLLTTLGFGAPVPRTTIGRTVTVIFAAIGIPAHFLLIMNLGLLLAVRLQRYAIARKFKGYDLTDLSYLPPVPKWVKIVPFVCVASYYLLGVLCFGVARSRPIAASVLFPLDFTAAGGLSTIVGYVRILYGLYLEGAVTIAAIAVAVLGVSTTQNLTNIGLKYGLLIEA